jgi:SOS-response transcriptional repressor LexA
MPMPKPPLLSPRQAQLCETITKLTEERGYPPSLRECAAAMGLHFTRIARLAHTTAEKGAIAYDPGIGRSWRVVETRGSRKAATR